MNLALGAQSELSIEVIRTNRRKTASIEVNAGQVRVIVPRQLSQKKIEELLLKKAKWIREKLRIQSLITPVKPKEFVSGESFSYLGKNYRLKLLRGDSGGVKLLGGCLVLAVPDSLSDGGRESFIKKELTQWYRIHAGQRLTDKSKRLSKILGVSPNSIELKDYKSRWGGCSANGIIKFNWRIIMAPHKIVDYVVVHELCHMTHHDHSSRFWKSVEAVIPDYREHREWLKFNGQGLRID